MLGSFFLNQLVPFDFSRKVKGYWVEEWGAVLPPDLVAAGTVDDYMRAECASSHLLCKIDSHGVDYVSTGLYCKYSHLVDTS